MRLSDFRKGLALLVALVLLCPVAPARALSATATFRSGQDVKFEIPFDEAAFLQPGQTYRHGLAQSSLGMALSAFRERDGDIKARGRNVSGYLGQLQFEKVSLHQYDIPPSLRTIASAVGRKQLTVDGQAVTLLAVAVSGGGYGDEWKSNFTIGTGTHHEGFDGAAGQVLQHIRDYMKAQGITGRVKVWLAGYSRAAATANRTAAMLLDQGLVKAEDLYAYTFATPNVTRQENAGSYPSIFNIVGAFDPVPMVPFSDWGFGRYGSTYYLPSPETNSDYARRVGPVNAVYRRMMGTDYWQNLSSNRSLFGALSTLADKVNSTENYAANYQNLLIGLWDRKSSPWSMLRHTAASLWQNNKLRQQMGGMADNVFTLIANALGENAFQRMGTYQKSWQDKAGFTGNVMREHFPQGYLAWLMAYDNLEAMKSDQLDFRQLLVNVDCDIRLYDARGQLLLSHSYVRKEGEKQLSSALLSQSGDALVLTVPGDAPYRAEIRASAQTEQLQLTLREGRVGRTGLLVFGMDPLPTQAGKVYELKLQPTGKDYPDYVITWQGGSQQLKPAEKQQQLTHLEQYSESKTYLYSNLVLSLLLLVLVVVQVILYASLFARALRRRRRAERRALAGGRRRLWLRGAGPARNALKLTALATSLPALVIAGLALFYSLAWLWSAKSGAQGSVLLLAVAASVPGALVALLTALPALAASGMALIWRDCDLRGLRACRLNALLALPFAATLLVVQLRGLVDLPLILLFYATLLLLLGLLVQVLLSQCLLRAARGAGQLSP